MQKARRSSIQSTKTYKAFQAFQPQDLPQAFQFCKDIPVIHDIPDIPVIHDIPAFQALLHVPVTTRSSTPSTFQRFQYIQGFHPLQLYSILQLEFNSTHRLVSTRNSIEYQSKTIHYKLSFFKEREMLQYGSE